MKIKLGAHNISVALFVYWLVLVIWQNISTVSARSDADIIIKIALLVYLLVSFAVKSKLRISNFAAISVFFLTQIISFLGENSPSLSVYISYTYTLLIVALVLGMGRSFTITKIDLIKIYNAIVVVALYAAAYALLFCTNQFKSAFSISSAYGNELSSFFSSSHEYAMYMAAAIICCVIGIEINRGQQKRKNVFYIIALCVLIPNLILTFSRTVLLGTACFFFVYVIGAKNSKFKKWIIVGCIAAVLAYFINPQINRFVENIVFKGNVSGGRNLLYDTATKLFNEGSLKQKTFGYGIGYSRTYLEAITSHGSVHNAYLQVLLYFGAVGLLWLIGFLIVRIFNLLSICNQDHYWGSVFLGLIIWAAVMMYTNTFIIFTSSVDCYFLTMFAVIIPLFSVNAIKNGTFEKDLV